MPAAKKTTTRKTSTTNTTKKSAEKKVEEKVEEVVEEKVEKKPEKKKFNQDDGVVCRSVTVGGLSIEGPKTGMRYRFPEYGAEIDIEYRDLVAICRSKRDYVLYPYIVVMDEDFVEETPVLKEFYDEKYTEWDLRDILELPAQKMIEEIEGLPKGARETLKQIAATEISSGSLDSVQRIKALDNYFGTELSFLSEVLGEE